MASPWIRRVWSARVNRRGYVAELAIQPGRALQPEHVPAAQVHDRLVGEGDGTFGKRGLQPRLERNRFITLECMVGS
jgi:hypothetical protein